MFYESGPRLAACLSDLSETLGGARDAAVARELTKLFEETRRAPLANLAAHYAEAGYPKGEIVVLIGPPEVKQVDDAQLDEALREALKLQSVKHAAAEIAQKYALPKRDVYQRALALKDG